ncbi:MAG: sarcosine oxidase subunit gamma [Rhodospirillaceae bacterium]|jgi:sarcosine oxidase, subunit gamma|nr:sarcosine oxidase subunit gamma [Rhodospirillaceae bacterium]
MPERYLRQSALAHLGLESRAVDDPGDAGLVLCERAHLGKVGLRGDAGDKGFLDAVAKELGFALPLRPNTVAAGEDVTAFWLGPNEWLLAVIPYEGTPLAEDLDKALTGLHAGATVLTDSRTVIGVSGPAARDVLAKGCPLDLHPSAFPSGSCAQSLLAKADVLIYLHEDGGRFDLYVPRSYADYLWRWLEDAGAEYGVAVSGD